MWGGPVLPDIRQEITHCLGVNIPPLVTAVRVYGYGLIFALESGRTKGSRQSLGSGC